VVVVEILQDKPRRGWKEGQTHGERVVRGTIRWTKVKWLAGLNAGCGVSSQVKGRRRSCDKVTEAARGKDSGGLRK